MSLSKCNNRPLTVEESLEELRKKRARNQRYVKAAEEEQWEEVDRATQKYTYPKLAGSDAFAVLDVQPHASRMAIFFKLMPPDWLEQVLHKCARRNKKNMVFTKSKVMMCMAIYILVQGKQQKPIQNQTNRDAQRVSFMAAVEELQTAAPNQDPPGVNLIEKIHSQLCLDAEDEKQLSANFQSVVLSLGQWVAGDEKLFHYTGNSAFIRSVPSKPDRIGLWNYELTCKVCIYEHPNILELI